MQYHTMAEAAEVKPCSNSGCDQPGTKSCSACKTSVYCGVICQTANWAHHKEECDGHLRKMGKANLDKAAGFHRQHNWAQVLRYAEIAATKLKQLKDRRLETVELIDKALACKLDAKNRLGRYREAMKCAEERYTLWAMNHLRNPGSIYAGFALIVCCLHNEEFEDAENYARHAYFMIAEMTDNFIPADKRPFFLAEASHWLAQAIVKLVISGGIAPEKKQKAGEEAITLARQALKIHTTQLHGTESTEVACILGTLATALDVFNDTDNDEVIRLYQQAISILRRVEGSTSVNVAAGVFKLANSYQKRARRAQDADDADRCMANVELSLSHYREAARIYTVINHVDMADRALRNVAQAEECIQRIGSARAAAAAAATAAATRL